jgi:exodeoxyribonuclease-3
MRIITVNVNGIRAAARKGFFSWMVRQRADVICIQETKAQVHQLQDPVFRPRNYHAFFHDAEKKGYSGVAIYSRHRPNKVIVGLGWPDVDAEGRYLEVQFGSLSVISLYMHSGSSSEERQQKKFDMMERFMPYLRGLRRKRREYIICGDWNIAHKAIDLRTGVAIRRIPVFCPKNVPGWKSCLARPVLWMLSAPWISAATNTPGGQTGAAPGRKTLAGVSTTRW